MIQAIVKAIDALGAINSTLGRYSTWLAAILIGAMTLVVIVGVFFRYVLNNSIAWSEEFAIVSAIWVAFLVAPYAYRTGGHVGIEMVLNALPDPMMRMLRLGLNLLVLWILYRFFQEALVFVERGNFQRANAFPIKTSWFRGIVPVSIAMMFLVGIELMLRDLLALATGSREHDLPHLTPVEPE